MKKIWVCILIFVLLSGCAQKDFETVGDVFAPEDVPTPQKTTLLLPEDAAAQAIHGEEGNIYFCDGYEIMLQTLSAGDLNQTVKTLSGFNKEKLTIFETVKEKHKRYEYIWTAAGEGGDQIGRAVILDDGNYHYCLSVMASAPEAGSLLESWNELMGSFTLQ